jgi:hypothetical protein
MSDTIIEIDNLIVENEARIDSLIFCIFGFDDRMPK